MVKGDESMAYLSISASARASGKDRNTIKRYLKDGRLSSTKDASGNQVIDTAELVRVFGPLVSTGAPYAQEQTPPSAPENPVLSQVVETLREQLRAAQEREEWLKGQLEAAQARSAELEQRMLPQGEGRKGFFVRFFGR
jgi:hypothetical protein